MNLDEQFAALPDRVKAALMTMLHRMVELERAGQLADADRILRAGDDSGLPEPARTVLRSTKALLTAMVLELHEKRVDWALAEGFEGVQALLVAQGFTLPEDGGSDD